MPHQFAKLFLQACIACLVSLGFLISPARATASLKRIEVFNAGDATLNVCTSFDSSARGIKKIALLELESGSSDVIYAFNPDDWPAFVDAWTKAKAMQGEAQTVAVLNEKGNPGDPSKLTISGGAGVKFLLESKTDGKVAFELLPADVERFETAVQTVKTSLTNQSAE